MPLSGRMAPVFVLTRFRPLYSMEDPPKRMSSSVSVRVFSSCKLLAAMEERDFATGASPPLRRDDVIVGGANALVVDRVDDATSATNALTARWESIILTQPMKRRGVQIEKLLSSALLVLFARLLAVNFHLLIDIQKIIGIVIIAPAEEEVGGVSKKWRRQYPLASVGYGAAGVMVDECFPSSRLAPCSGGRFTQFTTATLHRV